MLVSVFALVDDVGCDEEEELFEEEDALDEEEEISADGSIEKEQDAKTSPTIDKANRALVFFIISSS